MIIIITLGFDEKFALRAITRRGLKPEDEILIVMSKPFDERAEKAFQNFTNILEKAFQKPKITRINVEAKKLDEAISTLLQEFLKRREVKFVINLSGGLRALITEVLISALILKINGEVEVELEDSSGLISFPLEILYSLNLDEVDKVLLNSIKGEENFSTISRKLNISKTTVWRRIKRLQKLGVIKQNHKISLTKLGFMLKPIYYTKIDDEKII
jgi:CRISPR-associated protein Csa3